MKAYEIFYFLQINSEFSGVPEYRRSLVLGFRWVLQGIFIGSCAHVSVNWNGSKRLQKSRYLGHIWYLRYHDYIWYFAQARPIIYIIIWHSLLPVKSRAVIGCWRGKILHIMTAGIMKIVNALWTKQTQKPKK